MDTKDFLRAAFQMQRMHRSFFHNLDLSNLQLPLNKTQTRTLLVIYHNQDNKMSDISRRMGLEKGSFTTLIEHLIDVGYVVKEQNKQDKRRIRLRLTPSGVEVAKKIEDAFNEQGMQLLDILTDEEQEKLLKAMKFIDHCAYKIEKESKKKHHNH